MVAMVSETGAVIRRSSTECRRSATDVLAMPDLDHGDRSVVVIDRVEDPMFALASPVALTPGELLAARRTRVGGEPTDRVGDATAVLLPPDRLELFQGGTLEQDTVVR